MNAYLFIPLKSIDLPLDEKYHHSDTPTYYHLNYNTAIYTLIMIILIKTQQTYIHF